MTDPLEHAGRESPVDLGDLVRACWPRRWLITIWAISCGSMALVLAFVLPKNYIAWTLLSPRITQQSALGGAGKLLSQYAGIAGLSISANREQAERIAMLSSRAVVGDFINRDNLLPILFRKKWNSKVNSWRRDVRQPTLYDGIKYFRKHILTVVDKGATGLVVIRIEWQDPRLAAAWANGIVKEVNQYMRLRTIRRAKRHIEFLNARAKEERLISQQQAIAQLMETELGREMVATGSQQYAFRVLDPALVPEKPSFPKPSLWAILGLMFGGLMGSGYALIRARGHSRVELQ